MQSLKSSGCTGSELANLTGRLDCSLKHSNVADTLLDCQIKLLCFGTTAFRVSCPILYAFFSIVLVCFVLGADEICQ